MASPFVTSEVCEFFAGDEYPTRALEPGAQGLAPHPASARRSREVVSKIMPQIRANLTALDTMHSFVDQHDTILEQDCRLQPTHWTIDSDTLTLETHIHTRKAVSSDDCCASVNGSQVGEIWHLPRPPATTISLASRTWVVPDGSGNVLRARPDRYVASHRHFVAANCPSTS